ncbi:hypothetical protein LB452_02755 [Psychroflexus sp. CAK8W]|uniref:Outer membrane protein beta-barrel domain-containing protein n=1 Tax=Psychroflexus longus TaxID=2873596 RepID=A0ABS7XFT7_9FLAO|nr:hypothetical protein [Psychroflexus longus]MBZ9777832.1 hypothetical protein [Psychroflexus longus]
MKKSVKILSVLLFLVLATEASSQITASFYANSNSSKFALGYNINERFWTDLRVYSDTSLDNVTPEIVINHNIVKKNNYDIYFGAGAILNNINAVIIPVGIGIKPIESLRNLSFNIEFNPIYEFDLEDVFIRGFIGIRYILN